MHVWDPEPGQSERPSSVGFGLRPSLWPNSKRTKLPGVTEAAMAAKWPLTVYERAERPAIASLMTGILRE